MNLWDNISTPQCSTERITVDPKLGVYQGAPAWNDPCTIGQAKRAISLQSFARYVASGIYQKLGNVAIELACPQSWYRQAERPTKLTSLRGSSTGTKWRITRPISPALTARSTSMPSFAGGGAFPKPHWRGLDDRYMPSCHRCHRKALLPKPSKSTESVIRSRSHFDNGFLFTCRGLSSEPPLLSIFVGSEVIWRWYARVHRELYGADEILKNAGIAPEFVPF